MISYTQEDIKFRCKDKRKISRWISEVAKKFANRRVGEIVIVFCSDNYLREINKRFLSHDYYTDVITFDYTEGATVSGDILISIERLAENSAEYRVTFEEELHRVMIHGILHLLGYKDSSEEEREEMREKEDLALDVLRELLL